MAKTEEPTLQITQVQALGFILFKMPSRVCKFDTPSTTKAFHFETLFKTTVSEDEELVTDLLKKIFQAYLYFNYY